MVQNNTVLSSRIVDACIPSVHHPSARDILEVRPRAVCLMVVLLRFVCIVAVLNVYVCMCVVSGGHQPAVTDHVG